MAEETILALPASLDFADTEALLPTLREAAAGTTVCVLECGAAERISTPAVQMLLSLEKTLRQQNGALTLRAPSPALARAFADLGLGENLNRWSKEHG